MDQPELKPTQATKSRALWLALPFMIVGLLLLANVMRPSTLDLEELDRLGYVHLQSPVALKPFELLDHHGTPRAEFSATWHLVFFGFTYCPDICPTTLAVLGDVLSELTDNSVQVVLISVDPERDTTLKLREYVTAFNPSFVGMTGQPAAISVLAKQLHVIYQRGPDAENYLVDHTTNVALVNPEGSFVGYFRVPHIPQNIVAALTLLME